MKSDPSAAPDTREDAGVSGDTKSAGTPTGPQPTIPDGAARGAKQPGHLGGKSHYQSMHTARLISETARAVNDQVFSKLADRALTLFLVGAHRDRADSVRNAVCKELLKWRYVHWLDVYYPEDMFEELMESEVHHDLLSLETLLAKSVHAIVIILERDCPGALAELGVFASSERLSHKVIVVVDEKYKGAKSFIMLGPVRYLEKKHRGNVLYHNLRNADLSELSTEIRRNVRRVADSAELDRTVNNPIAAQRFLLAAMYVLQPASKRSLRSMVQIAGPCRRGDAETVVTAALAILLKQKEVVLSDGRYTLTGEGRDRLRLTVKTEPSAPSLREVLDRLRVRVLNETLRRRMITV
jgi:hypothetical protein